MAFMPREYEERDMHMCSNLGGGTCMHDTLETSGSAPRGAQPPWHGPRHGARGTRRAQPPGWEVRHGQGPERQPVLADTQPADASGDDRQAGRVQSPGGAFPLLFHQVKRHSMSADLGGGSVL